ncbi:hypothetical protein FRB99_004949 [Tulasnella sp. 403]|nr:hypothetical protein FRB99_004949 [Tulasnella sp. 403]
MSAGNSETTSQGVPVPYKPPTTTPIKTRVSSQAHLAHTRDSIDPSLRSDLESTLQRVPPTDFLKGLAFDDDKLEEEVKTMCNDIKDDENIGHLLDSIGSARMETDTYTPFATICNTITNKFTERYKDLRKRTVKFYGLGKTYLSGPDSYHCGVRVGKTGSSRKPDGLGILVKDPEEELELDRIARKGATKSDKAKFEWRTTLLCVEHKLSSPTDNDAVPQELQNGGPTEGDGTNSKRKRSTQPESTNDLANNVTNERSAPPPTKRFRQTPETSKSAKSQGPANTSSSTVTIAPSKWTVDEVQLASYAMETICTVGNRRWVFGLLLDRLEATLWYYDRSGAICTESFDIRQCFPVLARYIIAISTATDKQLGFNFDLQPPPGITPGSHESLAPANLHNWAVRCQDSSNPEKLITYTLLDTIDVRFGIVGRGTVVYTGRRDGTNDEVAVKLSWQVVTRGKEWEWIAAAKENSCPGEYLVAVHGHGVYGKLSEGFRHHLATHSKPNRFEDRELRVLVTERVRLLTEISDGKQFLELVRGFVTALYCLDAAGIRHRDISTGNLGYKEINGRLQPKLLDFDHARFTGVPDGPPTSQHLTGTLPFMAIDLLRGLGYMHPLRFDLESLMWCSVWILTCCHEGKEVCGARAHPLRKWFSGTNEDVSGAKVNFFTNSKGFDFQSEFEVIEVELQRFLLCFSREYTREERLDKGVQWKLETSEDNPLITHAGLLRALGLGSQQVSVEEIRVEAIRVSRSRYPLVPGLDGRDNIESQRQIDKRTQTGNNQIPAVGNRYLMFGLLDRLHAMMNDRNDAIHPKDSDTNQSIHAPAPYTIALSAHLETIIYSENLGSTDDVVKSSWQVMTRKREWKWITVVKSNSLAKEYFVTAFKDFETVLYGLGAPRIRHLSIRTGGLGYEDIEEFQPKLLGSDPLRYIDVTDAPHTSPRLTGTPPFMAIDLLFEPGTRILYVSI